jgi:predicted transcriptional regulator
MSDESLSPAVRTFIAQHLASVEELEILLFLLAAHGKPQTIESVYQTILSSKSSVERALEKFIAAGLARRESPDLPAYSIQPAQAAVVQELQDTYRRLSVRVIEAIYQKPRDAAQTFADAFKFKREP